MRNISRFIVVFLALGLFGTVQAQDNGGWHKVDSLMKRQYYTQAYNAAEKLYRQAVESRESRKALTAAWYMSLAASEYQENAADSALARFGRLLPMLDAVDQAVCRMFIAKYFASYYSGNSWLISRNAEVETEGDYRLWSKRRFMDTVEHLVYQVFADVERLKATPSSELGPLVERGTENGGLQNSESKIQNSQDMTPTLFDVLAGKSLDEIMDAMPFDKLLAGDFDHPELFLAEPARFVTMRVKSNDPGKAMARFAIEMMQQREAMHLESGELHHSKFNIQNSQTERDDLLIELYRERFGFVNYNSVINIPREQLDDWKLVELPKGIAAFRKVRKNVSEHITQLYCNLASVLYSRGQYGEAMAVCDTSLALFPENPGSNCCHNLKLQMLRKLVFLHIPNVAPSTGSQLCVVTTRNVDTVFFRIVKYADYSDKGNQDERRRFLRTRPVLREWSQVVGSGVMGQKSYAVVPQMPQGKYLLLASPRGDFKEEGIAIGLFSIEDIAFLPARSNRSQNGFVVDRTTGHPVAGLTVSLNCKKDYSDKYRQMATTVTDADGYYDFSDYITQNWKKLKGYYYTSYSAEYDGYTVVCEYNLLGRDSRDTSVGRQTRIFFDRPVYKPGDTVRFACLLFSTSELTDGRSLRHCQVEEGVKLNAILRDIINYKNVDTLQLATDSYGQCNGFFVLAADAMPGSWGICVEQRKENGERLALWRQDGYFKVEAYKQPKFTVTLNRSVQQRHFGQPVRVEGVAASYTSVPVGGAKVTYSVRREQRCPFWRWGWCSGGSSSVVVDEGELTTDEKGLFAVEFVPLPDSNADLSRKPYFKYTVTARVTDLNGETHEANTSLAVGFENGYLQIEKEKATDFQASASDTTLIVIRRRNLDGNTLDATIDVTVERLRQPDKPVMKYNAMEYNVLLGESHNGDGRDGIAMPLSREEFAKLFPLYDYDGTGSDYCRWPVQKKIFSTQAKSTAKAPYKFSFAGLAAGAYKVTASCITGDGDTLRNEYYVLYEPPTAQQPVSSSLITATVPKSSYEVGETVRVRVGSRYDDVTLYVLVNKNKVVYRHELHRLSKGYVAIDIPVADTLLGGFVVEVAAVKANQIEHYSFTINVPYTHKKLDVSFETFRNKLEPGSSERWTLRMKDKGTGNPAAANLLLTMYDKALDTYGHLANSLNPWMNSYTSASFRDICYMSYGSYNFEPRLDIRRTDGYLLRNASLQVGISSAERYYYGTARGENGSLRGMVSGVKMRKSSNDVLVTEEESEYELGIVEAADDAEYEPVPVIEIGKAESGVRLTSNDIAFVEAEKEEVFEEVAGVGYYDGGKEESDAVYMRQNLNTLAFFRPVLRSDTDGAVELSFTVPDLLTEWSISGIAWTKDVKVGTIAEKAVTQKRLMAVPNVPRFLRHGDTCVFSVKVSNISGEEQDVAVSLEMTDAVSDKDMDIILGDRVKHIVLKDGTSGEVSFTLAVPRRAVFVANYKVIARGDGCSDGEQAPIPLLPSRQLVTESMAFYINGAGEKHCDLQHLADLSQSDNNTLVHSSLTVDLTPNPVWLALHSLPYVARQQNPSNIWLANAYYANALAFSIVQNNPMIEKLFREWEKNEPDAFQSALDRNADLKQTVMEETPWLRDAVDEEKRHREIANYFDKNTLKLQLQKDISHLIDAQRSDGGWSWIEGGRWSSLYTTQYILKTFGLLQKQGVQLDSRTRKALDRAMDYVDRETYDYYRKYIKNKAYDFDVVNLDYLYVRSYYPGNKLTKSQQEAYDYFYNNAKKHNEDYRSLFTQAMLCVVFNRHGDSKLARTMAVRIKEKALYSDEMGMYWRDNTGGWCWHQRPIETQAMLVRTFDEVLGDSESITRMQQWLLKQKQTTNWNTDVASVNAIQALLTGTSEADTPVRMQPSQISVTFGIHSLQTDTSLYQLHISQRLPADSITTADGHLTIRKADSGIAWGAMYWQYFENIEKIPASSMGVTLQRSFYKVENNGTITPLNHQALNVGDKVRVRILVSCDRNLEYLELKDPRPAAFEPVNTASGWRWSNGLSFYCAITNAAQTLYIDRLEKGNYVVEYDFFVNAAGSYVTAPATIQCLYAPEFRALSPAEKLKIKK